MNLNQKKCSPMPTKVHLVKAMAFPVVMYGSESWTMKKAVLYKHQFKRIEKIESINSVVLEKSPSDSKEIKPVNPKGNQSWIFIVRTDAEAETPILWPPEAKKWLIGKDSYTRKDWRLEKGMTEDEMSRQHHQLNGCEFEKTLGNSGG